MVFFLDRTGSRQAFATLSVAAMICLGVVMVTGSSGCAPALSVQEEAASQAAAAAAAGTVQTQVAAPRTAQATISGRPEKLSQPTIKEATVEEQPFKIMDLSILEERGQTALTMKFSLPVTQYRHFSLTQPSRIVLDIFGDAKRQPRVENFRAETHWLSILRLSSGEGYLRLVMEIAAAAVPAYAIEPENGGLKVIIGPVNPELTARKELLLVQGGKRVDVSVAEAKPAAPETQARVGEAKREGVVAAAGEEEKKYTGQRISLDFKDADIRNVFRLLAEVSGLNIVVTDDVVRKVTIRLVDVPWDQALDLLIKTNGLDQEPVGNVVRISTAARLRSDREGLAAARRARETSEEPQVAYLSVNYATAKELADKLKPLLTAGAVLVSDDRSNVIIVRGIKKAVDEVNNIVSRLDVRTAQVQIESNLIETTPTFARALGMVFEFDYNAAAVRSSFPAGAPAGGTPFFSVIQNRFGPLNNLAARLSAAEKEGNIRIISRPSVVTLNNIPSTIQSLRILRITLPTSTNIASGTGAAAGAAVATERVNVGIILTVTPQVSSDGFVLMKINVKSSSIAESATVSGSSAVLPFDELSREANANVLVRDGETIVIGGIMKDTGSTSESGIPFLKDIPVLGWLFKNARWQKDFEELMVFITPRIVSGGSENLPSAEQLWRQQLRTTEGG
ncbi:MAG: secretin and TonB N-terminal domain-containing protein [Deltaproteobacteria bacterium]|nr:secretin and TonB N-terminal domain-containing protein [Deltaproteobacteria bacterium]